MSDVKLKSGLATAGMVLGIIGIVLSFIPIINNFAFVLGILALIFGIVPLVKKRSLGKSITAIVLGALTIIITLVMQAAFSKALDEVTAPTQTTPTTSQEAAAPAATFDGAAAYDKISNGMTKAQVRDVAGVDPESCSESTSAYTGTLETCSYGNVLKDSVVVSVTYTDGAVSNKMKMGS
jgi:hypothetical protein